jgi:dTDP-4-dehydrorhamnose 3,5-epimerase
LTNFPQRPEIIENIKFEDDRGSFQEWFNRQKISETFGVDFDTRQANISVSRKNVIRGMHFGVGSNFQSKLIMCAAGSINDVAVSIGEEATNFRQLYFSPLSQDSCTSIFIPAGFAHGFEVTSDSATVIYLQSHEHSPSYEFAINPLDPELGINWSTSTPILSRRDSEAPSLDEYIKNKVIL